MGGAAMTGSGAYGLTRRELERELQWMMRQAPSEPMKLIDHLAKSVITLIEKNNAAIARAAAEAARPDLPERH